MVAPLSMGLVLIIAAQGGRKSRRREMRNLRYAEVMARIELGQRFEGLA